jgi:hypothetical protein
MKIRSSFVSNSSSSSFVLYGFKIPEGKAAKALGVDGDNLYDELDRCGVEYIYDYEDGYVYAGKAIANWDDYESIGPVDLSLAELTEGAEKARRKFGVAGEPKVFAGTRST